MHFVKIFHVRKDLAAIGAIPTEANMVVLHFPFYTKPSVCKVWIWIEGTYQGIGAYDFPIGRDGQDQSPAHRLRVIGMKKKAIAFKGFPGKERATFNKLFK